MKPDRNPHTDVPIRVDVLKQLRTLDFQLLCGPRHCGRTEMLRHLRHSLKGNQAIVALVSVGRDGAYSSPIAATQAALGHELWDLLEEHGGQLLSNRNRAGASERQAANVLRRFLAAAKGGQADVPLRRSFRNRTVIRWYKERAPKTIYTQSAAEFYDDVYVLYEYFISKVIRSADIYLLFDVAPEFASEKHLRELKDLLEISPMDAKPIVLKVAAGPQHVADFASLIDSHGYQQVSLGYRKDQLVAIAESRFKALNSKAKSLENLFGPERVAELFDGHKRYHALQKGKGQFQGARRVLAALTEAPADWYDFGKTIAEMLMNSDGSKLLAEARTDDNAWLRVLASYFSQHVLLTLTVLDDGIIVELGRREPQRAFTQESAHFAAELIRCCLDQAPYAPITFRPQNLTAQQRHNTVSRVREFFEPLKVRGQPDAVVAGATAARLPGSIYLYLESHAHNGEYHLNRERVKVRRQQSKQEK